ncbi:MAG: PEP-CTERM sorting domain-containing protein, partial [Verrucomicrobiota bacterium]|nr:PEP-CTERM sorting domain-containing protein [Verrucomicrobiota bacterium]
DGNTRYFSFLMELGDATAVGRIEFGEAVGGVFGTGFRIRTDGANFIATGNSSSTTLGSTDTDTHLFVWKLTTGAGATDNWELFVDPTLASEGANTAVASMTGGGSSIDLTHLTLYREGGGTGGNGMMFDEIRIGETWADVTTIPEPATLGLIVAVGGALIGIRRLMI